MHTKSRLIRLERSKRRAIVDAECICFPPDEPSHLELKAEIEAARGVPCPLHGERFSKLAPGIYRVITLPRHLDQVWRSWHSPQYTKAMDASFPPDRWPARRVEELDGTVRFVLKDATEIHRTAPRIPLIHQALVRGHNGIAPPEEIYDLNTGEPCGWIGPNGKVLPLAPATAETEVVPPGKEDEVPITAPPPEMWNL